MASDPLLRIMPNMLDAGQTRTELTYLVGTYLVQRVDWLSGNVADDAEEPDRGPLVEFTTFSVVEALDEVAQAICKYTPTKTQEARA